MDIQSYLLGKKSGGGGGGDASEYFDNTYKNTSSTTSVNATNLLLKKIPSPIYIDSTTASISGMFSNLLNLTEIPKLVGGENATNYGSTFYVSIGSINSKITFIDASELITTKATNMASMFRNLGALTEIKGLNNFNTSKVTNMSNMFSNCSSMTKLDLSSFTNPDGVLTNTSSMFENCKNLKKIDMRGLTFSSVTSSSNMFGSSSSANKVPDDCLIIVKDNTEKTWITSNFSRLTNVKTVEEMEYTEVSYLEGTGTQYINTGFYPKKQVNFVAEHSFWLNSGNTSDNCVLGGRHNYSATTGYGFKLPNCYDGSYELQVINSGTSSASVEYDKKVKFRAECLSGNTKFYINDTLTDTWTATGTSDSKGNLYLFAMHDTANDIAKWNFNGRIYYCKIWEDNELVRDFIPVLDHNNTPCLFDKVDEKFYYNSGTGTFNYG